MLINFGCINGDKNIKMIYRKGVKLIVVQSIELIENEEWLLFE